MRDVARRTPLPDRPVKLDPQHPLRIGEEWYPDASKRVNEEGRCIVQMTVSASGKVVRESIQQSTGFPRLDEACLNAVHGQRMLPAIQHGVPVENTVAMPIAWKLTGPVIPPQTQGESPDGASKEPTSHQ